MLNIENLTKLYVQDQRENNVRQVHLNREREYRLFSDRHFSEASRKRAAGDIAGAEAAEQKGLLVVDAIKSRHPLPE